MSIADWENELQPGRHGFFTVLMPRKDNMEKDDARVLFQDYGPIRDLAATGNWVFVRYALKEEALAALTDLHLSHGVKVGVNRKPVTHTKYSTWMKGLVPDNRGWFSLCVEKAPGVNTQMEAVKVFSEFGPVLNPSSTSTRHFIRYKEREQAQRAMEKYKDKYNRKFM